MSLVPARQVYVILTAPYLNDGSNNTTVEGLVQQALDDGWQLVAGPFRAGPGLGFAQAMTRWEKTN